MSARRLRLEYWDGVKVAVVRDGALPTSVGDLREFVAAKLGVAGGGAEGLVMQAVGGGEERAVEVDDDVAALFGASGLSLSLRVARTHPAPSVHAHSHSAALAHAPALPPVTRLRILQPPHQSYSSLVIRSAQLPTTLAQLLDLVRTRAPNPAQLAAPGVKWTVRVAAPAAEGQGQGQAHRELQTDADVREVMPAERVELVVVVASATKERQRERPLSQASSASYASNTTGSHASPSTTPTPSTASATATATATATPLPTHHAAQTHARAPAPVLAHHSLPTPPVSTEHLNTHAHGHAYAGKVPSDTPTTSANATTSSANHITAVDPDPAAKLAVGKPVVIPQPSTSTSTSFIATDQLFKFPPRRSDSSDSDSADTNTATAAVSVAPGPTKALSALAPHKDTTVVAYNDTQPSERAHRRHNSADSVHPGLGPGFSGAGVGGFSAGASAGGGGFPAAASRSGPVRDGVGDGTGKVVATAGDLATGGGQSRGGGARAAAAAEVETPVSATSTPYSLPRPSVGIPRLPTISPHTADPTLTPTSTPTPSLARPRPLHLASAADQLLRSNSRMSWTSTASSLYAGGSLSGRRRIPRSTVPTSTSTSTSGSTPPTPRDSTTTLTPPPTPVTLTGAPVTVPVRWTADDGNWTVEEVMGGLGGKGWEREREWGWKQVSRDDANMSVTYAPRKRSCKGATDAQAAVRILIFFNTPTLHRLSHLHFPNKTTCLQPRGFRRHFVAPLRTLARRADGTYAQGTTEWGGFTVKGGGLTWHVYVVKGTGEDVGDGCRRAVEGFWAGVAVG